MTTESKRKLWVIESSGTPRSGKGTITSGLAELIPGAAQDETGADYRAVTFGLLTDGILHPEMDSAAIVNAIGALEQDQITHYAAQRYELVAKHGQDALYSLEVARLVGKVSPLENVRRAVKDGFIKRVTAHAEDPDTQILIVDGRNLAPLIEKVEGVHILLRLFVDCQPFIAAKREALRQKIDTTDPANDKWYRETLQNIQDRQRADESRTVDAVKQDSNAINYWYNAAIEYETAERLALQRGITFAAAADMIASGSGNHFRTGGRYGAGAKAGAQNRQIYFDTTEINKPSMLNLAERMVEEALEHAVNNYKPRYAELLTA